MAKDQFGGVDIDEFGGIAVEDEAPAPYEGPSGLGAVTFGGAARPAAPVIAPPSPAWDAWTGEVSPQLKAVSPWAVPRLKPEPPPSLTPVRPDTPDYEPSLDSIEPSETAAGMQTRRFEGTAPAEIRAPRKISPTRENSRNWGTVSF